MAKIADAARKGRFGTLGAQVWDEITSSWVFSDTIRPNFNSDFFLANGRNDRMGDGDGIGHGAGGFDLPSSNSGRHTSDSGPGGDKPPPIADGDIREHRPVPDSAASVSDPYSGFSDSGNRDQDLVADGAIADEPHKVDDGGEISLPGQVIIRDGTTPKPDDALRDSTDTTTPSCSDADPDTKVEAAARISSAEVVAAVELPVVESGAGPASAFATFATFSQALISGPQILEVRVAAGSDDAEEVASSGKMFLDSSDLELINDLEFVGPQYVGIRFQDLDIPVGAVITSAWIQFTVDETDSTAANLTIKAQASANAQTFSTTNFNVSGRQTTASTVTWTPAQWTIVGASGTAQRTADISALVQEVIALNGWAPANAMAFIFGGLGKRTAEAYESGVNTAPLLHIEYTFGSTGPAAPTIDLDAASDTGTSDTDNITAVTTPTLTGTSEANTTVTIYDGGNAVGTAIAGASGNWTFTSASLANGVHNFTAKATDGEGNQGAASQILAVTVDNVPPVAPTIDLDAASDTGASNTDNITHDATPTLTGTAEANATVTIYDGASQIGTVIANSGGAWSFTANTLATGLHDFSARSTDAAGNQSTASQTLTVTIEPPPSGPQILEVRVAAGSDDAEEVASSGKMFLDSSDLELINDLEFVGPQYVGIRFQDLNIPAGAFITSAWIQFTVDETDSTAANLTIKAQSNANAQTFSTSNFNVSGRQTTASTVTWTPAEWTTVGASGTAQRTADISALVQEVIALNGWAPANAMAFIFSGLGKRTAEAYESGVNTAPLLHIEYTFDNPGPAAPTIDLDVASDTGRSNTDNITVVTTPTLTGTSVANTTVTIYEGGNAVGTAIAGANGNWTFTSASLTNGVHNFTATATDGEGNQGAASQPLLVTVDTSEPDPPTIDLAAASDTGPSDTDNITYDATPTLTGTAEGNATVTIYNDNIQIGTALANSAGAWSFTATTLAPGFHEFSARSTDAAGNQSAASETLTVTIEPPPPGPQILEARVAAGSDDAEEVASSGKMFLDSSDLELINDLEFVGPQYVGIRFQDLDIPVGAVITSAWIQFTVDETDSTAANLTIKAQASANAQTFSTSNFNVSGRQTTASTVTWTPAEWTAVGASGTAQRTADISALVQEVIALNGWAPANAMAFIFSGMGKRTAEAYESGVNTAPLLHIEYAFGSNNNSPSALPDFVSTNEEVPLIMDLVANDTDPDGDLLAVAAFGPASHGKVTVNDNGTLTYTPESNYHGSDMFTYTVSDGRGGLSVQTVLVNVVSVNDAPEAIADLAVTRMNTSVVIKVLSNDRDVDGDAMTVSSVAAGLYGTTEIQSDGSILYTPHTDFKGIDVFEYTVSDGNGGFDTAKATVHVDTGFGTLKFATIGDFGVDNGYELAVSQLVKSLSPEIIVTLGDNTYGASNTPDNAVGKYYSDYIGNYQGAYGTGSAENRFFASLGNHDWDDAGIDAYLDFFSFPESSSFNNRYYDFVAGPVHFFITDVDSHEPDGNSANSVQAQWLQNGLENSVTPWQIVIVHEPPFSSGANHGSHPDFQWDFEQWGADAVFSGDDHLYERIMRDDNGDGVLMPYFVNGAGGAGLYPFASQSVDGSTVRYNSNFGAMLMTASDTELRFEFWSIANGGTLIDSFTMELPSNDTLVF